MSNRKLNQQNSTLPGDPGVPFGKKWKEVEGANKRNSKAWHETRKKIIARVPAPAPVASGNLSDWDIFGGVDSAGRTQYVVGEPYFYGVDLSTSGRSIAFPRLDYQRTVMERELERRREEERRAKREADRKERFDEAKKAYDRMLDTAKDATLVKVIEMHAPTEYDPEDAEDSGGGYWVSIGRTDRPHCKYEVGHEWPCDTAGLMMNDLIRREATDPFLEETGVSILLDGAL